MSYWYKKSFVLFFRCKIVKSFVIQFVCLTGDQYCAHCQWRFLHGLLLGDVYAKLCCYHLELPLFLHCQVQVVFDNFSPSLGACSLVGAMWISVCLQFSRCSGFIMSGTGVGQSSNWDLETRCPRHHDSQGFCTLKCIALALHFCLIISSHSFGCANTRFCL